MFVGAGLVPALIVWCCKGNIGDILYQGRHKALPLCVSCVQCDTVWYIAGQAQGTAPMCFFCCNVIPWGTSQGRHKALPLCVSCVQCDTVWYIAGQAQGTAPTCFFCCNVIRLGTSRGRHAGQAQGTAPMCFFYCNVIPWGILHRHAGQAQGTAPTTLSMPYHCVKNLPFMCTKGNEGYPNHSHA
jgi:hypothetical protein